MTNADVPDSPDRPVLPGSGRNAAPGATGDTGGYPAGPGWDACTGLGSQDGAALLARLQQD